MPRTSAATTGTSTTRSATTAPPPRQRRAAVAALPTITAVSRASLLAGALTEGRADGERAAFEHDPRWRGRSVRLFHRGALGGGAGAALHEEVVAAISGEDALVAVVINTVDDSLDAGREGRDPGWRIDDVAPLAAVLHHARAAGRAVVLTSDHGHVPEHGTALRPTSASLSARHRMPTGEVAAGEVELAGRRVLAPGGRIVALWDSTLRYNPRRAGGGDHPHAGVPAVHPDVGRRSAEGVAPAGRPAARMVDGNRRRDGFPPAHGRRRHPRPASRGIRSFEGRERPPGAPAGRRGDRPDQSGSPRRSSDASRHRPLSRTRRGCRPACALRSPACRGRPRRRDSRLGDVHRSARAHPAADADRAGRGRAHRPA
ncbi:BREX-2 system phosphatase PglZ [Candidatus Frankia alpina]|uniref:BREX-2 system phosphatase PglZ n=1 Tax=Candidatus Frankia alpina TaxID=2699483 RepID=A0A4S5EQS8_9ACTN|nr:BREX-2 system phosphatase PglZ [Candidatus Frankia alpina]